MLYIAVNGTIFVQFILQMSIFSFTARAAWAATNSLYILPTKSSISFVTVWNRFTLLYGTEDARSVMSDLQFGTLFLTS